MFWARKLPTRLYIAYICQAIYGFDYCKPGHTHNRLFQDHPYHEMWDKIQSFYERNGYGSMSDTDVKALFHKYAIHGMKITRGGVEETIPPGAMYEAQALWEKRSWLEYEKNRKDRRTGARKIALKIAIVAAGVAAGGPLGGVAAWAGGN